MFKRLLFLFTIIAFFSLMNFGTAYSKTHHKTINFDTTGTYKITTIDDNEFIGKFLSKDSLSVTFLSNSKVKIQIPVTNIKDIQIIKNPNFKNGEYWFENPNASRYLFSSSAINLKKGQGYYQNTYIFLNSFGVGISDNLSLAAGIEFLSTFSSISEGHFTPVYFVSPKLGFELADNLHLGVGYFYSGILSDYGNNGSGYLYGVATFGSKNNNFSFTLGLDGQGFDFNKDPIIGFSGTVRVGRGVSLMTDNLLLPSYESDYYHSIPKLTYIPYFTYGVRLFGEKLAVDLALVNNSDIARAIFIGFPYVDFVVNF